MNAFQQLFLNICLFLSLMVNSMTIFNVVNNTSKYSFNLRNHRDEKFSFSSQNQDFFCFVLFHQNAETGQLNT